MRKWSWRDELAVPGHLAICGTANIRRRSYVALPMLSYNPGGTLWLSPIFHDFGPCKQSLDSNRCNAERWTNRVKGI